MDDLAQYIQDNHKYRRFNKDDPNDRAAAQGLFSKFLDACHATDLFVSDVEKTNLTYEKDVIIEIVERVRMRKLYFYVYHDFPLPNDLNELKETALYTFWILKLHPFRWRDCYYVQQKDPLGNYELNARAALCFFIQGLKLYADGKTRDAAQTAQKASYTISVARGGSDIIQTLYYSFRYRDWSKEALMDLAESMIINVGR